MLMYWHVCVKVVRDLHKQLSEIELTHVLSFTCLYLLHLRNKISPETSLPHQTSYDSSSNVIMYCFDCRIFHEYIVLCVHWSCTTSAISARSVSDVNRLVLPKHALVLVPCRK